MKIDYKAKYEELKAACRGVPHALKNSAKFVEGERPLPDLDGPYLEYLADKLKEAMKG